MSAETIKDPSYIMGWPISFQKQVELAEAIKKAHEQEETTIVGVWCAQTGFAVLVEILEGRPFHWHCTGAINVNQAKKWFKGMEQQDRETPVSLPV